MVEVITVLGVAVLVVVASYALHTQREDNGVEVVCPLYRLEQLENYFLHLAGPSSTRIWAGLKNYRELIEEVGKTQPHLLNSELQFFTDSIGPTLDGAIGDTDSRAIRDLLDSRMRLLEDEAAHVDARRSEAIQQAARETEVARSMLSYPESEDQ